MNSKRARKTMSSTVKPWAAGLLLGLSLYAQADAPPALQPYYQRLASEGQRNAVLNRMEIGARAFEQGRTDLATEALDTALAQIESVYGNSDGAAKARSLWYEEGRKDFKGEPYERVMAYYYRGLLYLQEKDWGNARASFEGGMLQDAFAEEDQNRFDFALMAFLSAWASQQEGNKVLQQRALAELKKLRPDFTPPPADHDTLLIIETGNSPRKLADGVGHYELVYRRGKFFKEQGATLDVNGQSLSAYPMEDIFWQATSRGGRAVDRIIKGKASFRATNAGIGGVLADTASVLQVWSPALDSNLGGAAAALGVVGATQMVIASMVQAKADTRYWSSLPDAVHVLSFKSQGEKTLRLDFNDAQKQTLPELGRDITLPAHGGLVWVRSRPAVVQP